MNPVPFQPRAAGTFFIANAVAASTPAALSVDAEQVVLYNSSKTATAFWRCQIVATNADTGSNAVIPTAGSTAPVGDIPIPPTAQIRLTVGHGQKRFSVIADAADGNLYITPGQGN